MIATEPAVSCPRCKRTAVTPLAAEGDLQRFNCQGCGENFSGPALRTSQAAAAPAPDRRFAHVPIMSPDEGLKMVAGTCPKCQKPYLRLGKKYDLHVAACDGKPFVAPVRRPRKEKAPVSLPPEPGVIYELSLASLRARRAALEAELRGIDQAIADIEKLRGVGGAAPAPFVPPPSSRSSLSA